MLGAAVLCLLLRSIIGVGANVKLPAAAAPEAAVPMAVAARATSQLTLYRAGEACGAKVSPLFDSHATTASVASGAAAVPGAALGTDSR